MAGDTDVVLLQGADDGGDGTAAGRIRVGDEPSSPTSTRCQAAKAQVSEKERVLLDYVKVLTLEPASVRDTHVAGLRQAGWTDEQIFEASFITALFAFFNRMADAHGLDYPTGGWFPPDYKEKSDNAAKDK